MKNKDVVVGIFVAIGLLLFGAGIFLVGGRQGVFSKHVQYYTELSTLNGLVAGSKVSVAGMDAGQIEEIAVPDSPAGRFRIKLSVNARFGGLVRTDSTATVATEGIVGGTYLFIRPGSTRALVAAPQSTLPSQEPVDMSMLLQRGLGLMTDVDVTINQLRDQVGGTLGDVRALLGNVNDVTLAVKDGHGAAGMLLNDPSVAAKIRESAANIEAASSGISDVVRRTDMMVADLQSRGLPVKIDETIGSAHRSAQNVESATEQIRTTIAASTGPDESGVDAATHVRDSLANLDVATVNAAESTEALKHNFLVRGYFRKRGFYNLSHLSRASYREDKHFASPDNPRIWLSTDDLFTAGADGNEKLTLSGRQAISDRFAAYGDTANVQAVIVEGYSESFKDAEQRSTAGRRAVLVRDYLAAEFSLDRKALGTVSLANKPPKGLGHETWDGVCVVLLKEKR